MIAQEGKKGDPWEEKTEIINAATCTLDKLILFAHIYLKALTSIFDLFVPSTAYHILGKQPFRCMQRKFLLVFHSLLNEVFHSNFSHLHPLQITRICIRICICHVPEIQNPNTAKKLPLQSMQIYFHKCVCIYIYIHT